MKVIIQQDVQQLGRTVSPREQSTQKNCSEELRHELLSAHRGREVGRPPVHRQMHE